MKRYNSTLLLKIYFLVSQPLFIYTYIQYSLKSLESSLQMHFGPERSVYKISLPFAILVAIRPCQSLKWALDIFTFLSLLPTEILKSRLGF